MTTTEFPSTSPDPDQPDQSAQPAKRGKLRRFGIPIGAFILGVVIGTSGGSSADEAGSVSAASQATATVTATPPAVTEPAATVTVEAPAPAPVTVTAAPVPDEPESSFDGDGTFVVGEDIQPGTYRNAGSSGCYWARLSGLSGAFGDIIANDIGDGPQVVQISPSDAAFETTRCGTWELAG